MAIKSEVRVEEGEERFGESKVWSERRRGRNIGKGGKVLGK